MIRPRICFLTACLKTAEIVKAVASEMSGFEAFVECIEPLNEDSEIMIAQKLEANCDVIITQSGTRDKISKHINIPIIDFYYSFADILAALYEASKIDKKAVLIFHKKIDYDLAEWPQILKVSVMIATYSNRDEVFAAVEKAKELGAVAIGSTVAVEHALQIGALSHMIIPGKSTIKKSLCEAAEIVVATRREKERSARYKALLDFTHEGVIFLEDKQKIAYVNSAAEDLLKKNEQQLVGRKITELIKPEDAQVMSCVGRTPVLGKLFKHENESIIANIVPIYVGNQNTGTIITFFEASRLQSVEYDLRRKLASKGVRARFTLNDIIGKSRPLMLAKQKAEIFADNNSTVVITGESGVGKELFAQSIHNLSSRRNKSFVPLNCSALPKELIESELFGYEEGAFTGAKKGGKEGLFELAHGGTVFLDEIGTMPLELQSKMLRVLQEKEVTRLGGTKLIPVDVRIIVATNSNLNEDVREGKFREDLFYRLNVLPLHIPSLRERYEDIPLLFEYFVQMYNKKHWRSIQISSLKNKALLQDYYWPGNVRELMNFCERFVILSAQHKNVDDFLKESLEENTIKLNTKEEPVFPRDGSWKETWHGLEKTVLKQMISEQGMNKAELAKSLGISRTTLWKKLRE